MLKKLKAYVGARMQEHEFKQFQRRWAFHIKDGHFSLRGVGSVNEFGYLLSHYTQGRFQSFRDFKRLAANKAAIVAVLRPAQLSDTPWERNQFGVSLATARGNLRDLILILECIEEYVRLVGRLSLLRLPLNPLK